MKTCISPTSNCIYNPKGEGTYASIIHWWNWNQIYECIGKL